jgi:hypothetical protein
MGFTAVIDESLVQKFQQNYRHAFRAFIEATEELLHLQEADGVDLSQIREASIRIRDAQAACRDTRDRLACLLLETRRRRLLQSAVPYPAQFELLEFISRVTSLLAREKNLNAAGPLNTSADVRLPNSERGRSLSVQA